MHEHRVAGIPVGGEVRQALGGQIEIDADVGDDEAAFVARPFETQIQCSAHRRARAVGGDEPARALRVLALGRIDLQRHAVVILRQRNELVAPSHLDERLALDGVHQITLEHVLLQVDQRRESVVFVHRRLHAEDALAAIVRIPAGPWQALGEHRVGHAHGLQNLLRATREDDGAAAFRDLLFGLEHDTAHPMACQRECGDHTDGAAAHDGDRDVRGCLALRRKVRMDAVRVIKRRARGGLWSMHDATPKNSARHVRSESRVSGETAQAQRANGKNANEHIVANATILVC